MTFHKRHKEEEKKTK